MGKLMKYDLRAAMKLFIPLWLGTLVLSIVNSFTLQKSTAVISPSQVDLNFGRDALEWISGLVMFAYIMAIMAVVIITLIYVVMRFYQSMVKDEAYLTFTLPVTIDQILWGKAFTALILLAISGVVCVLSLVILMLPEIEFKHMVGFFRELLKMMTEYENTLDVILICVMLVILAIVSGFSSVFHIYLSMGFGQLAKKRKIGASVLSYVGINIAVGFVSGNLIAPLFRLWAGDSTLFTVPEWMNQWQMVWLSLLAVTAATAILTAIYYFPTRYIFTRKLNLE